ncbi:GNAT family N-acetyltransferase [Duganella violaceipulchra]|uniref:GNAT family N-acetyltransferase n=1 Tax=Duganella violaceipulchra TaxID=2849652 RepID=A0AA41HE32_9BURK|nr:GNAT family N-acetyltransferase [Duganella violaceicalia]MBV6322461.1 GNAT family N-acetyltransferase [Duganella violaceicalia]MCP2010666.1 phosphinothricin acetyltransferase [Duganella violaceicalia]
MEQIDQFTWRRAVPTDADAIAAIYNESVNDGGHSPVLAASEPAEMDRLIRECRRHGWPSWVLLNGDDIIAWSQIRPIAWGPEVCHRTGDLSLYVRRDWHGRGVAMQVVRNVYREAQRHGFDAITCWILGGNRKSLMVARAFRMARWGCLPRAALNGDREDDVVIYGVRFDDLRWQGFMDEQNVRHRRRQRLAGAG